MDQSNILDFDDLKSGLEFGHLAPVSLKISGVSSMSESEIIKLISDSKLPLYAVWPERKIHPGSKTVKGVPLQNIVLDVYRSFKPRNIGWIDVKKVVKVNESAELHGTIHYTHGHHIDASKIERLSVVYRSSSIGLVPSFHDRTVIEISKVMAHPYPEEVTGG